MTEKRMAGRQGKETGLFVTVLLISLLGCSTTPKVSTPSEVAVEEAPSPSVESLSGPGDPLQQCIDECVASRQMEAVAIEMIEESCAKGCADAPDPLQAEEEDGGEL
jgi:hypothetical protein